jgi:hypothetical protein
MKSLANVLQDQDTSAIVDSRNQFAKAMRSWAKALITAFPHFVFPFRRFCGLRFPWLISNRIRPLGQRPQPLLSSCLLDRGGKRPGVVLYVTR